MIGLIFGETNFPKEILKKVKKRNIKYIIIDLSAKKIFRKNKYSYSASIGQFSRIIKILRMNNCKKVLFAGKVKKPSLTKLKLDLKGMFYLPKIINKIKLGDAAILKEIINILKKEGIKTISSLSFNPELSLKKGCYSKIKPNSKDKLDIKNAIKVLAGLNKYNYSQGVVVKNKKILATEGKLGTQKMLIKIASQRTIKQEGVLVKFPKKKQSLNIDLPTIGIKTLRACKLARIKGIVLKSKYNVIIEKKKCISYANKNKMYILAL